ncbi:MAG: hypothetical protein IKP16_01570 [Prevotella sp.]|nr:hypothetical protein [Prevotella sp.]
MKTYTHWLLAIILLAIPCFLSAQETPNSRQARQMFDRTYNMVFGAQGCSLNYDVNLVGVYKARGSICYKGKKSKFVESRYVAWNDGVTHTLLDNRKKTVSIFDATSDKKDKYSSNFKFSPDDYTYSVENAEGGYLLTLKLKPGRKGMKIVKALIDKQTRVPINLRIKVALFWAHINITNFKHGNISDAIFKFPAKQYTSYKVIDKRGE